jgi:hypothetical protein
MGGVMLAPLVFAAPAAACSCAPLTQKDVNRSDAAVVVRLDSVEPLPGGSPIWGPGNFTYTVRRAVRPGRLERGDVVTIHSPRDGAACGLEGREGERYGMLLDRRAGEWRSSLCQRTSPRELRRLADGRRRTASGRCS